MNAARIGIGGLLLAAIMTAGPALAQNPPQPGATPGATPTQSFKDWALDCLVPKTGEGAGKRVCFIHHEVHNHDDAKLISARVVIRRAGPQQKLMLIIQLPPNTTQASGILTTVDVNKPRPVAIQGCLPKFCYGAVEITPDLEAEARAGSQIVLGFAAKDKGPQQISVPLAGITAALVALQKTGS
jgi:invasion protein IalB